MLKPRYEELRKTGITQGICDFCANAFQVKDKLKTQKQEFIAEYR